MDQLLRLGVRGVGMMSFVCVVLRFAFWRAGVLPLLPGCLSPTRQRRKDENEALARFLKETNDNV